MTDDKPRRASSEVQVMAKIDRLLEDLSLDARGRILRWLADRHEEQKRAQEKESAS